jgi:hypothetical protein
MEVKGIPPKSLLQSSSRSSIFFDSNFQPKLTANSKGKTVKPNTKSLTDMVKEKDEDFIDFIDVSHNQK